MSELIPGDDGEPLPLGEWVIRICKQKLLTQQGKVHELLFRPTDEDRRDPRCRLTVWAERLTTDEQASVYSGAEPATSVVARLLVREVRGLRPEPEVPDIPYLEVEWHPLAMRDETGNLTADDRPGANGHAGLRDLTLGTKAQMRSLRQQLADMAERNRRPVGGYR